MMFIKLVASAQKYEMLEICGIDSVIFTKNGELDYSVDFAELGTYESYYEEADTDVYCEVQEEDV